MWLSLKCSRLSFRRNTVSFICVSQENICFILIVHSHELAMVREHVCPTDPESCAGGSRSSCQGHPSQTVQKVKARQSTVQTLLPCKMAGDSQRLWKQTWRKCTLKTNVLGPESRVTQACQEPQYIATLAQRERTTKKKKKKTNRGTYSCCVT